MIAQPIRILTLLSITCLLSTTLLAVTGRSQFTIRSQGMNMPRNMVGMEPYDYCLKDGFPCFYFGITPAFSQSFSDDNLEQYLFFNGTNTMTFGPLGDRETDVFARNFLLNDDFRGNVTIKPDIQSMVLDLQFRISLNKIACGLYLETYIPVTWSQWDLHMEERVRSSGTFVEANKLGNATRENSFLKTIIRAWQGDTIDVNTFPAVRNDMDFATVNGKRSEIALADVYLGLGYTIIKKPDWQVDLQLLYIAPAGKRPEPRYFFNAQVGNGKHNAIGGALHTYHNVFTGDDTALTGVFDIRAYHFFGASQRRTFDLNANGIGSRYLLFKRFNPDTGTPTGEIVFGPNVTTLDCNVSVGAVAEATMMATYDWYKWQFNVGANAWIQSKEHITLKQDIPARTFGIQGNTNSNANQTASQTLINGQNANMFDPLGFPVFIGTASINLDSAKTPTATSYMLFAHASRTWKNNPLEPFVGIGGELELSAFSNKALEQFSIWFKAGFSYA
ncbi:MAG: hypothetical protein AB7F19_00460 [Candidatus Babeliales bacterium]